MGVANISGNILTDSGTNLSSLVSGSGTTNYLPKFTSSSAIGNSSIFDNGTSVGVGTATPFAIADTNLTVNGTTSSAIQLGFNGTRYGQFYTDSGEIRLSAVANLPLTFYSNNLERMRITSGGQIGIGITPTGSWGLQMYGNGTASSVARIQLQNSSTGSADGDGGGISMEGIDFVTRNNESGVVKWELGGTERMRINSNGFLKLSNTGTYFTSATNSVNEITSDTTDDTCRVVNRNTAYGSTVLQTRANRNTTNSSFYFFQCYNDASGSNKLLIADSGNITNTNGSYGTISSDRRLKENIVSATPKLNDLMKLNVVNFNLIGNEEKHIGFIAQEMQEVFPSFIYQTDTREYDEDGNVTKGLEDALGVKVGMEFAILVKAIQELSAKVTALEQKA